MLVIVETSSQDSFPSDALLAMDELMKQLGFRKEIRSVVSPGRTYSTSYEGPEVDLQRVRTAIQPILDRHGLQAKVDAEESVHFP